MTRKGGAKFRHPHSLSPISRNGRKMHIAEMAGSRNLEQNAFSFIPNAPLFRKTAGGPLRLKMPQSH
jgi:hypothetical protein